MASPKELFHDRYEVLESLGEGGMGRVLKAKDQLIDRVVAIKVLHAHLVSSDSARKRFLREAKAMQGLHHPNLCEIFTIGVLPAGQIYLTSEFVDGVNLNQRLAESGPLTEDEAMRTLSGVLAGLRFAHAKGIVHRDLTPANIMLCRDGTVKVVDFGLAKLLSDSGQQKLTQTGAILGTAAYMSPEQLSGGAIDLRTDIYSLGCTMYAAASGASPWSSSAFADLAARSKEVPKPLPEHVSDRLRAVIMLAMEPKPDQRFQSAEEMQDVLSGALPITFRPKKKSFAANISKPQLAIAVALLILMVGISTPLLLKHKAAADAHDRFKLLESRTDVALGENEVDRAVKSAESAAQELRASHSENVEDIRAGFRGLLSAAKRKGAPTENLIGEALEMAHAYSGSIPRADYTEMLRQVSSAYAQRKAFPKAEKPLLEAGGVIVATENNEALSAQLDDFFYETDQLFTKWHPRATKKVAFFDVLAAKAANPKILKVLQDRQAVSRTESLREEEPAQQVVMLTESLEHIKDKTDFHKQAKLHSKLAAALGQCERGEEASKEYIQAVKFARLAKFADDDLAAILECAATEEALLNRYETVVVLLEEAEQKRTVPYGDTRSLLKTELELGRGYRRIGQNAKAASVFDRAVTNASKNPAFQILRAHALTERALEYRTNNEVDKAEALLKQALRFAQASTEDGAHEENFVAEITKQLALNSAILERNRRHPPQPN